MTELKTVGGRHLIRLGVFGIIFAVLFCWLIRMPLERTDDSVGGNLAPRGPFAGIQVSSASQHLI